MARLACPAGGLALSCIRPGLAGRNRRREPHTCPFTLPAAGTHACLLLFLALLLPLPLRAHMRVQAATVALLVLFGVHTHCRSLLFNTAEFKRVVFLLNGGMSLLTGALSPVAVSPPPGAR